jgi:hypothetical protein
VNAVSKSAVALSVKRSSDLAVQGGWVILVKLRPPALTCDLTATPPLTERTLSAVRVFFEVAGVSFTGFWLMGVSWGGAAPAHLS